jgi:hypothetical protein
VNRYEVYVNTIERETVEVRPVVARMARQMEALFALHDGGKTMEGETLLDSIEEMNTAMSTVIFDVLGKDPRVNADELALDITKVANRAALSLLLLTIPEEG